MEGRSAITIKASPDEVYAYWRDLEHLPTFMYHLESVEASDGQRSHWVAKGPVGATVEWDAEITEDVPGQRIAWRSLEGGSVETSGNVRFQAAPGDQGTEVHVELDYSPPGGVLGSLAAKLFGEEPNQQLGDDLRRLKQVLETGEIARSAGSPLGSRVQNMARQRDAHPSEDHEVPGTPEQGVRT